MAALRRPKYLTCFYCGKRTSTRYDGRVRRFECPSCDATNYLDENGEITDPPVATSTPDSKPPQYAVARTVSPKSSTPSQDIFCETCLKNQHLFTASLAQYFPEDIDHPEYAELEKNYYKFRRGLEQRYPQVCANCESKVLDRIQAAGYTAKTDHLRRMIDRSRQVRSVTARSPLDLFDAAGKWLWIAGLILQLTWHASTVIFLFRNQAHHDDYAGISRYLNAFAVFFEHLPPPATLIYWSVAASISSSWWNPRFVQMVRGFTKHVMGLPKWYTYQIMLVLLKVAALRMSDFPTSQEPPFMMQIGAHAFMVIFISFIYNTARRSIKTDTTPLFGARSNTTSPQAVRPSASQDVGKKSMSDILDDILEEPSSNGGIAMPGISTADAPHISDYNRQVLPRSSYNPSTAAIAGNPFKQAIGSSGNEVSFDSLSLDTVKPVSHPIHYDREMDWSPTQSRHRAFNTLGAAQGQTQRFGETPTEPKKGQFWYKVPPAPTNPAQRIFNPPNAPRIRTSPAGPSAPHFRGSQGQKLEVLDKADEARKTIDFAEPSFFSQPQQADPRNTLSDLFGQRFSLSPSQREAEQQHQAGTLASASTHFRSSRAPLRIAETMVLVICLAVWYHASSVQHQYVTHVSIGVLAVCIAILASINGDTLRDIGAGREVKWASAGAIIMGISEIYLATVFALELWTSGSECGTCNNQAGWLIGLMIMHQLWDTFLHS